jgi:hypothetical protein
MSVVTGSASNLNNISGISQIIEITAEEFNTLANKVLPANIFVKLPNGQISLTDGVKSIAQLTPLPDTVTITTDQTITGSKTFTDGIIVSTGDNGVTANSDNSYLELTGATSSSNGAWLDLHGKNDSRAGAFRLAANDGVNTVRLVGSANGELTWDGVGFVMLSGNQTIAGVKTFSSSIAVMSGANGIKTTNNTGYTEVCGGTDNTKGAFLNLHGKDHATQPGVFKLAASNGTTTKRLVGDANGSLTWDGNTVLDEIDGVTIGTTQTITGDKYFSGELTAVAPDEDDDSAKVATTSWVQNLVQNSGGQVVVDKGQREVWRVTTASASGASITLPNSMSYVVGDNRLFLSVNGAVLLPTYNYTEVGNSGETSTSVSILMPLSVGDEVMAWTVPVCVGASALDSIVSRLTALENTITDLSSESF